MGGSETGPGGPNREWCEVDFRPAPPGWVVVFEGGKRRQMVGWLVSELRELRPGDAYAPVHPKDDPPDNRPRKVTAAVMDDAGIVVDATERGWFGAVESVIAPGELG